MSGAPWGAGGVRDRLPPRGCGLLETQARRRDWPCGSPPPRLVPTLPHCSTSPFGLSRHTGGQTQPFVGGPCVPSGPQSLGGPTQRPSARRKAARSQTGEMSFCPRKARGGCGGLGGPPRGVGRGAGPVPAWASALLPTQDTGQASVGPFAGSCDWAQTRETVPRAAGVHRALLSCPPHPCLSFWSGEMVQPSLPPLPFWVRFLISCFAISV